MARPKTPLKTWLMLSLAVLLLHLVLLQSMPLSLSSMATNTPSVSFAMRTLTPEPVNVDVTSPAPAAHPQPKPRPKPRPKAAPPTSAQALPALDAVAPTEPGPTGEPSAPEPTPTALAPQGAASALPRPEPEALSAPRAPREKAANLNVSGVPGAIKLVYKVESNKFPYSLSGELVWAHDGTHYVASLAFGAFGQSRVQTSRGLIGTDGLMPERFSDKFRSEMAAHFNRAQGKVSFSANTPDAALLQGGQDRLSVLIQLAALVASAPERFAPATTLTLQTVGPRDADLWLFTVGDMETLELPGGTVQGLKLTRNPRQAYDQQVDIWLAPTLGYLPARVRITEANGDYIDQKWAASEAASMP